MQQSPSRIPPASRQPAAFLVSGPDRRAPHGALMISGNSETTPDHRIRSARTSRFQDGKAEECYCITPQPPNKSGQRLDETVLTHRARQARAVGECSIQYGTSSEPRARNQHAARDPLVPHPYADEKGNPNELVPCHSPGMHNVQRTGDLMPLSQAHV